MLRPQATDDSGDQEEDSMAFVRIARFEGAGDIDTQLNAIRADIEQGRRELKESEEASKDPRIQGMRAISRVIVAYDDESNSMVNLIFCDTAEDLKRADQWLNSMSPGPEAGQRTGVEKLEIGLDETTR
jgi:hypothetical protein